MIYTTNSLELAVTFLFTRRVWWIRENWKKREQLNIKSTQELWTVLFKLSETKVSGHFIKDLYPLYSEWDPGISYFLYPMNNWKVFIKLIRHWTQRYLQHILYFYTRQFYWFNYLLLAIVCQNKCVYYSWQINVYYMQFLWCNSHIP